MNWIRRAKGTVALFVLGTMLASGRDGMAIEGGAVIKSPSNDTCAQAIDLPAEGELTLATLRMR